MKLRMTWIPRRRNTSYFGEWPWAAGNKKYVPAGLMFSLWNGTEVGYLLGRGAREVARRFGLEADGCVKVNVKIEKA